MKSRIFSSASASWFIYVRSQDYNRPLLCIIYELKIRDGSCSVDLVGKWIISPSHGTVAYEQKWQKVNRFSDSFLQSCFFFFFTETNKSKIKKKNKLKNDSFIGCRNNCTNMPYIFIATHLSKSFLNPRESTFFLSKQLLPLRYKRRPNIEMQEVVFSPKMLSFTSSSL